MVAPVSSVQFKIGVAPVSSVQFKMVVAPVSSVQVDGSTCQFSSRWW